MSEFSRFLDQSRDKATDEVHRLKILKAISTYDKKVEEVKPGQFRDWEQARKAAAQVKSEVLDHLPFLLEEFESKITERGAKVLWAKNTEEAQRHFLDIAGEYNAGKVVKSKSMTTEEIEFNELCEKNSIEVLESDLGELIVQLAAEKPYHIVTPAMHKSKEEIGRIFHEKLGAALSSDARELTMIARNHLREAFVSSQIGVTGANFIIAREGALVMTENEGNIRLTMSCPPVQVIFVGIEKVLPRLSDLALFLPLLATSGTGQQITGYNSIVKGPKNKQELDGPEELYVILLDNGRSELFTKQKYRSILSCIRCGACLNACPVYRTVGGHSYHTTYQGPIGSVITPQLKGMQDWGHLAFASSLCASCSSVCPVNINIHELLLENRWESHQQKQTGMFWNLAIKMWAWIMSSRFRLDHLSRLNGIAIRILPLFLDRSKRKRVPELPKRQFLSKWKSYEKQR